MFKVHEDYPSHRAKRDSASEFKQKSFTRIKRKKLALRILKISVVTLAIIMTLLLIYVYTFD